MTSTLRSLLDAATRSLPRKCVAAGTISMTGDCLAQHVFEGITLREHNFKRSARMGFYGGAIFAPIMNGWFRLLGRIQHRNLIVQTLARVGVDQGIGGPFFPAIFYTSITLLEGGKIDDIRQKLRANWFNTWIVGLCVFAPSSAINQSLIAPQNRVLFMNGIALCWNIFLSHKNSIHHQRIDILSETEAVQDFEKTGES